MASGFSNKQDQLTPTYYRVAIDTSTYSTTAADNDSGGVEAWDYDYFTTFNTTKNNSIRRARGNIRWNAILQELQRFSNCEILDVTVQKSGPTDEEEADDTAASITFTVGYAQEEYVFNGWQKFIGSDTLSDGSTHIDGTPWEQLTRSNQTSNMSACIQEAITRGICIGGSNGYTRRYRTYDPVIGEQRDLNVTVESPDTLSNVWADLTVGIIDSMTQETF